MVSGALVDSHSHFLGPASPGAGPYVEVDAAGEGQLVSASSRRAVPRALWDVDERLRALEEAGVEVQVVSPVAAAGEYAWAADAGYARSVNDGLAAACARSAGRLIGLGCVSGDDAAGEVERCMSIGLHGIQIGTTLGGLDLDDPALEPMWQALEAADASVLVHPVAYGRGVLRRAERRWDIGLGMPTDAALAICALAFGGVLARHPGLRIAVAAGGGTFAWSYGRLVHAYGALPDGADAAIRRIYVDTTSLTTSHIPMLMERFGSERILLGSDAPFVPGSLTGLADFADEAARTHDRDMFARNAREFLGMEPG